MPKKSKEFSKIADEWLASKKFSVRESSYYTYEQSVQRLKAFWGDTRICDITPKMLSSFEATFETDSDKTADNVKTVFNSIILFATKNEKRDPLSLSMQSEAIADKGHLTSEEIGILRYYASVQNSDVANAILVLLFTGVKIGELSALRWEDVDLNSRTIKVNKSLKRVHNIREVADVKTRLLETEVPERKIPISNMLLCVLKMKGVKRGYVASGTETPIEPRLLQYNLQKFFSGFEKNITANVIRESLIINAIKGGANLGFLQEIMGISLERLLEFYVKVNFEIDRAKEIEKI